MEVLTGETIRKTFLEVISEYSEKGSSLQSGVVLGEVKVRLKLGRAIEQQQALITFWGDFFRMGYLAWGYDLSNPNPPFCHLTEQGRRALEHFSRDPANPDGYLSHIRNFALLEPITESYLVEALHAYNAACFKATAVLVGGAAESIILSLRDAFVGRMKATGISSPRKLLDWRIKIVLDVLRVQIDTHSQDMPKSLFASYQAYWNAFTQQIRIARNNAGHPASIDPVSAETVHASLLMLPDLIKLATELTNWVSTATL